MSACERHLLDPKRLPVDPCDAASIKGAAASGRAVGIDEMEHVELIVCGTVAVTRKGVRIGKGGGYSDLELGLLVERGLVDDDTTIATNGPPASAARRGATRDGA